MRAIGCIRVSTEGQAQEGVSLGAQRAAIEHWCKAHGHDLVEIYEDAGLSGAKLERPGLQNAQKPSQRPRVPHWW